MAAHTLTVSDNAADEVINIGEVKVDILPGLKLGDKAPDFKVTTFAGEKVRLKKLRGKVVLLQFWASWCGESTAQLPAVQAVHDTFGKDKRFVMLGLGLDREPEPLQRSIEEHGIRWPQSHLGDWSQTTVPTEYSVTFIPEMTLIGPDGIVLARGLRGPKLREEVDKALAAMK